MAHSGPLARGSDQWAAPSRRWPTTRQCCIVERALDEEPGDLDSSVGSATNYCGTLGKSPDFSGAIVNEGLVGRSLCSPSECGPGSYSIPPWPLPSGTEMGERDMGRQDAHGSPRVLRIRTPLSPSFCSFSGKMGFGISFSSLRETWKVSLLETLGRW